MDTDGNFEREFWAQVAARLRERISTQDWASWFSGAQVRELGPECLVVEVVNGFAVRWIEQHFGAVLRSCVEECAGAALRVVVVAPVTDHTDAACTAPSPNDTAGYDIAPGAPRVVDPGSTPRVPAGAAGDADLDHTERAAGSAMTEAELLAELSADDDQPSRTLASAPTDLTQLLQQRASAGPAVVRDPREDAQLAGVQPLDPRYRFENFVIGPGNQMVHAAALSVAESPAQSYNPLFVHGPTGLGKTHLLHAIGHYVRETRPDARIAYVTTEQFLHRFLGIIQAAKTDAGRSARDRFKSYFRDVDVLLMDDVQFLAGRGSWMQEELFHMFNALHGAGRQIVLTSDCPPERIPKLEDRLRSRFAWGLIADIESPDRETRIAILRRKAMVDDIAVPHEVFELVAEHVTTNVRELEGALTRVIADASLRGHAITRELAERVLVSLAPGSGEPVTIERIQHAVCEHYGLTREELLSERRARAVSLPRQIGMYLSRQLVNAPSTQVAMRFNRRDHSTILHAEKKIDALIRADHEVHDVVSQLTRQLRAGRSDVGSTR